MVECRLMLPAILTTLFFALSGVTGHKVAVRLGSQWGNFVRLVVAVLVLGLLTFHFFPDSLQKNAFLWFFISGLMGFGLGDTALFAAYQRLGSRLTFLLNLCLAPVFALLIEWLWLGSEPVWKVLLYVILILSGVALAVLGDPKSDNQSERTGRFGVGVLAAIIAGFGQGSGAVISRKADQVARGMNVDVPGISAAFQRVIAGLLVAAIVVLVLRFLATKKITIPSPESHRKVTGWILGAALFGPVIGVSCFQWALRNQESGIVLAVVALTPIVMMPIVAVTEHDRPGPRSILGACLAVTGVVLLYLWAI